MSDFYDSLEDEARDYSSSDSLCSSLKNKLNSIKKISYHDSSSHDAFYLKKTPGLVSNKKHGRPKLGNIVEKKLYSERQDDVKCIGECLTGYTVLVLKIFVKVLKLKIFN